MLISSKNALTETSRIIWTLSPTKVTHKINHSALADMAPLVGVLAYNLKVAGSIPAQGMYLDGGFNPLSGRICDITN